MTIENLLQDVGKINEKEPVSRRSFLGQLSKGIGLMIVGSIPLIDTLLPEQSEARTRKHTQKHRHRDYSKIPVPNVDYKPIIVEPNLSRIRLADNDTMIGRIQRSYRWRNITRAVERRYSIPSDYLLGMMCIESEGDPTQPNNSGDGGVGLIHMQPLLASKYGLDLITNSRRLRDFRQGKKIDRAIDMTNGDLKDLIKVDERFHPIKNIDAAGRMLCDF